MSATPSTNRTIGILALQGDFDAHRKMLSTRLGIPTMLVRTAAELAQVDALALPGGESTTMMKLLNRIGLDTEIATRARAGMPIYGTCAGMILMAKSIESHPDQPTLGVMDVTVSRNAFGRQVDSFETDLDLGFDDGRAAASIRGVFIRAPYVTEAGTAVHVLVRYRDKIVGVQQGSLLATAFHPELTDDPQVHAYFARIVDNSAERRR